MLQLALDPWENIHSEVSEVAKANETLNLDPVSDYYNIPKQHYCLILGKVTHCHIKCAHLWPRATLGKGLDALELDYNEVNSPRNFLRLHEEIEKAFDRKRLYFSVVPQLIVGHFKLQVIVVDPCLLKDTLTINQNAISWSDINNMLSEYTFTTTSKPFMRVIAQHALKVVDQALALNWIAENDLQFRRNHALQLARLSLADDNPVMAMFKLH